MHPVWESVSNGWRRKVLFLRGVGVLEDVEPDVEHQPEQHEQEYMEDVVDVQLMEEQELKEELQAIDKEM